MKRLKQDALSCLLMLDAGAKRSLQKQAAHLLSQMGGCIAIRHHGGITPEAELPLATRALLLTRVLRS
jgi:hypothetical protein